VNPSLFLEPLLYDLSVTLSCVLATTAGAVVHDVVVDFFSLLHLYLFANN